MGGETSAPRCWRLIAAGLSPRGRGNRPLLVPVLPNVGSIPAWAGKPVPCHWVEPDLWVYPRVGGETRNRDKQTLTDAGLSPRGRGNLRYYRYHQLHRGSIPAWAGKPAGAGGGRTP